MRHIEAASCELRTAGNCLRGLFVILLGGALSCSDNPAAPLEACTGPVTLTVTNTPRPPRIQWTPRCGASELSILQPPSGGFAGGWTIRAGTKLIPPDVRFSVVPDGTAELAPPPMFIPAGITMGVFLRDASGATIAQGAVTF